MDSMIHKLEKYADNLEDIVQQRTAELVSEKQKMDMLLHRMLPTCVFLSDVRVKHGRSRLSS